MIVFKWNIVLYLNRCDIHTLNFFKKLELPIIEEIYLNTCFINEFYPLSKYNNLNIIEMRDNYIKNIDKLESFIGKLPELKLFNIKGNNIDMNLDENKAIMEFIKIIRNNLDIIIWIFFIYLL